MDIDYNISVFTESEFILDSPYPVPELIPCSAYEDSSVDAYDIGIPCSTLLSVVVVGCCLDVKGTGEVPIGLPLALYFTFGLRSLLAPSCQCLEFRVEALWFPFAVCQLEHSCLSSLCRISE